MTSVAERDGKAGAVTRPVPPVRRRDLGWIGIPLVAAVGLAAYWLLPDDLALLTRIAASALFVLSLDLVLGYGGIATLGQAAMFGTGAYAAGIVAVNWNSDPFVMLAAGVLYLLLGNYMGKLRRNFFIGIRTPWTLASDAVWERTHRVGGRLFMLGGLATVLIALVDPAPWLLLIVLAAVWLITAGYSYFIHLRLEGSR